MEIIFRPVEEHDLYLLRDWRNAERIRKNCREYRLLNMFNQEQWFKKITEGKTDDMFIVMEGGICVGVCGLTHIDWKNRSAQVSYYLGSPQNSLEDIGIGLEVYKFMKNKAFKEYNLHRLWGEAFEFNKGGVALALKSGFKQEAILRGTVFWNSKYWDSVIVAMLETDYVRINTYNINNK